jgi:regulator of protease activity HflC (stomatin/prohibitin superfamily)
MTKRTKTLSVAVALSALLGLGACTNPETPAGHEGYIFHTPLMFGKMEFRNAQRGAATTGVSWRLFTENVDYRTISFAEHFQLLTADNLSVSFEVDTRIKLVDGSVREIVEEWGGANWYEWNVKEPLRTNVRQVVTQFRASDIQLETPKVRALIDQHLHEKYDGTPIKIESVDIGEIQFPKEVTEAIQRKIAKKQELERQEYVLAKTEKEAAIRVLEALRVAKQQRIISSTLDPIYVQRKAVQVYRTLAESDNKTIIMLPNSDEGTGMPLVLTEGKRKILSAADEKLLQAMEERYMKIAKTAKIPDEPMPTPAPAPEEDGAAPADPPADAPAPAPAPAPANP